MADIQITKCVYTEKEISGNEDQKFCYIHATMLAESALVDGMSISELQSLAQTEGFSPLHLVELSYLRTRATKRSDNRYAIVASARYIGE